MIKWKQQAYDWTLNLGYTAPSVISIIGFFMTNRKFDNIQELRPVQTEIGYIMKKLSDNDREMLSVKLKESLNAFSVKPVSGK